MIAIDIHKQKLIEKIQIINNEKTLNKIDIIIKTLLSDEPVYVTTTEQKKSIIAGLNDFEVKNYLSQEAIDKQDLEWLKE